MHEALNSGRAAVRDQRDATQRRSNVQSFALRTRAGTAVGLQGSCCHHWPREPGAMAALGALLYVGSTRNTAPMETPDASWDARVASLWARIDEFAAADFVARIEALAAELPSDSAVGLFERGAAQDSTGRPQAAVPLYRAALDSGLTGMRRRRATIQMASSLRNLGDATQAADLLAAELREASDELDGAVRAFLALALVDLGREREAVSVSLTALSGYLPRYNRSVARYAQDLFDPSNQRASS
jgi:hypothetical protein